MLTRLTLFVTLGLAALLTGCATPLADPATRTTAWQSSDELMDHIAGAFDNDKGSLNVSRVEGRLWMGQEQYRASLVDWPAVGENESYYKWGMDTTDFAEEHAAVAQRGLALLQKQIYRDARGVTRIQAVWAAPSE